MDSTALKHQETTEETSPLYVSLNEAARIWHRNKGNLSKVVKAGIAAGTLQWHEQPNGQKLLFLPELATRLGPPPEQQAKPVEKQVSETNGQPQATDGNTIKISRLEVELKAALEMLEVIRTERKREAELLADQLARERQNADAWKRSAEQAQEIIKALPAPANTTPVRTGLKQGETPRKLSFLERLTGRVQAK